MGWEKRFTSLFFASFSGGPVGCDFQQTSCVFRDLGFLFSVAHRICSSGVDLLNLCLHGRKEGKGLREGAVGSSSAPPLHRAKYFLFF